MEKLSRFDVAVYGDISMVIVESDLLPADPSVVVIPLLENYPAVDRLNPRVRHADRELVLATRLITSVRRSSLRRTGTVLQDADSITRAIDVLTSGF